MKKRYTQKQGESKKKEQNNLRRHWHKRETVSYTHIGFFSFSSSSSSFFSHHNKIATKQKRQPAEYTSEEDMNT